MPDDLPTARRFWEHLRKSQVTAGLPLSVHSASLPLGRAVFSSCATAADRTQLRSDNQDDSRPRALT